VSNRFLRDANFPPGRKLPVCARLGGLVAHVLSGARGFPTGNQPAWLPMASTPQVPDAPAPSEPRRD